MVSPSTQVPTTTHVPTPPATPTSLSTSAHDLLHSIRGIYQDLRHLSDLSPGEKVNGLLTQLVGLCIQPYGSEFTSYFLGIDGVDVLCTKLQALCGTAEGELEKYWARRIVGDASLKEGKATRTTSNPLHQFPYYKNYIDLSRLETSLISTFLPTSSLSTPLHIVFIGSGPLPLSSFCLLDIIPTATVYNVDRDVSALRISEQVSRLVGVGGMEFVCGDVGVCVEEGTQDVSSASSKFKDLSTIPWQEVNVIFLAALVGASTSSKLDILDSLAEKVRPGTIVVARSARGVRAVLYSVLELSDDLVQSSKYEVLAEVHPYTEVVNSVVLLKVR